MTAIASNSVPAFVSPLMAISNVAQHSSRVVHRLGCSAHEVERGEDGCHHLERISLAHLARSSRGSGTDCWTGDYTADRGVYG